MVIGHQDTMVTNLINNCSTVFNHHTLMRIHGEWTFERICTLHEEVMVNAQTFYSELRGGTNGHLGLLISPRRYALISNAPHNCLQNPEQLAFLFHFVHIMV